MQGITIKGRTVDFFETAIVISYVLALCIQNRYCYLSSPGISINQKVPIFA